MKALLNSVYGWADERLGLSDVAHFAQKKTVPEHAHSFWYYWGGLSLFLFLVQAVTGVLLLVYYRPGPEAFESVRQITYEIHFGWLIRSVHSWAANLMVFAVFVHMFSVFFMKAYRRPREFGWWSGMVLLMLVMVVFFFKIKDSPTVRAMLTAVRPVVIGLLIWTAYDMTRSVFGAGKVGWGAALSQNLDKAGIALVAFGLLTFTTINPVFIILGAAVLGLVVYR